MTHQKLLESAASYALDALDEDERTEFEAHLATCRQCQSEVAAYREVAAALAHSAPRADVAPPPGLRDRILSEARQVRPIATAAANSRRAVPPGAPRRDALPTAPGRGRFRSAGAWIVTGAALAAAAGFVFAYAGARSEAERLRGELAAAHATIAREDSTLAALLGPEVHVVSLAAAADRKPAVRVFWNHTQHRFIVTALGLSAAPAGRTYQLWAIRKGRAPMSMGTFDADPDGRTVATIAVAPEITAGGLIDDCALTVEPRGGSPQPTETPRMVGTWRHVD